MRKKISLLAALLLPALVMAKSYQVTSPDGKVKIDVETGDGTTWAVSYDGKQVLHPSALAMKFGNGVTAGARPKVNSAKTASVDQTLRPVVRQKSETVADRYIELTLRTADRYSMVFRAYDDGAAYRFVTDFKADSVTVEEETVELDFGADYPTLFPKEESIYTHQERLYQRRNLSKIKEGEFCSPPMIVTVGEIRVLPTEADLESYGGLYLQKGNGNKLKGLFAHYPLETKQESDRDVVVTRYADYIAKTAGKRSYPWRTLIIAADDARLPESQMIYKLASEGRVADVSWIKPGKVAWDWWNKNNIKGVDFRAGVNNDTYKYYIDFAAKHGLEYVILDEGWYELEDIMKQADGIDVAELCRYGKAKGVGVILWTTWKALEEKEDEAIAQFADWGVAGMKIDFMQRDDQPMVEFYYRIADKAAKNKMLVDYHGSYKPTGLQRTYPNVISFEGVKGMENMKWSKIPDANHNTTLPFTRMVAGPMDYTPGAMRNYTPEEYYPMFARAGSLTTRCHQLGLYVIFESPLQMLADAPSNYEREPETMEFLEAVPSVWDETKVLKGEVGEYIVTARRSGEKWFIGALTNRNAREVEVPLDFLPEGSYTLQSWEDGINADQNAEDFRQRSRRVTPKETLKLTLAPSGGYVAILSK